jgi:hypothetical protein
VDVSREENERRMKLWLVELGLEADPVSNKQQVLLHQVRRDEVKAS